MKCFILAISILFFSNAAISQFEDWGYNSPTLPLKKIDFNNSFLVNSNVNFFQFDAIIYPLSLFFNDRWEVMDIGLGGGVSTINSAKIDPYAKILLNKDWSINDNNNSRWGNDVFANYLFHSKQINLGLNLSFTKGYNEYIYFKLKMGPSYFAGTQSLFFNTTLTLGLEGEIATRQVKKPVVYFYPLDTMNLEVSLQFPGELSFCYPAFQDKWDFTIYPNSTFVDNSTNKEYPYLFWEGDYELTQLPDIEEGFIVAKENLVPFFEEKLATLELNRKEITDFITFWTPTLSEENYQIQFITQEDCNDIATYHFSTNPDTFIRLIALFKPVNEVKEIAPQILNPIKRNGFTIVEWGGIELDEKKC